MAERQRRSQSPGGAGQRLRPILVVVLSWGIGSNFLKSAGEGIRKVPNRLRRRVGINPVNWTLSRLT